MQTIRASQDRGQADHGWLKSQHSFSFGHYYDPKFMGVSKLRVINEDNVAPGTGFDTHGHQDMEILSYVLNGTIEHKDSMGNREQIPAGDFQIMSAGTGVTHSEYNPSTSEPLHFLQIWLLPNQQGVKPKYEQQAFANKPGFTAIVHPSAEGALHAHTDALVYRYQGDAEGEFNAEGDNIYVQVVTGEIVVNGQTLKAGDGLHVSEEALKISGEVESEALVFDLP